MPVQLILTGRVSYALSLGFGDVYRVHVDAVTRGELSASTIDVTVLASSQGLSDALAQYADGRVVMRFTRLESSQPYARMPINGFVDDERTTWELVDVKAV